MSDSDVPVPEVPPKPKRKPNPNLRGRQKGVKNKPKILKGTPSRKEWEDVSRLMFNSVKERLIHRDDETGLPTAPPALYAVVANLIKQTETTIKEEPVVTTDNEIRDKLKELRKRRTLVDDPQYITKGDISKLKRSQQQTGAIKLDEAPTLPVVPWDACNTLDTTDED